MKDAPKSLVTMEPTETAIEAIFKNGEKTEQTFGEVVERIVFEVFRPIAADLPIFRNGDKLRRFFKPWPVWVLKLHAEVLHIRAPTIEKETIFEILRVLHFFALEFKLDMSSGLVPEMPKIPDGFLGAIYGHFFAHFMRLDEKRAVAINEQRDVEAWQSIPTLEKFQKQIVPTIAKHLDKNPEGFLLFHNAFAKAKESTFDKNGNPKETPLTPIYKKILADWTVIECLSGPTALTEYLSPLLGNQHFDEKYERVKKICQRMDITFQPFVKGQ